MREIIGKQTFPRRASRREPMKIRLQSIPRRPSSFCDAGVSQNPPNIAEHCILTAAKARVYRCATRMGSRVELRGNSNSETLILSGVPIESVVPGQQSAAIAAKAGAPIHRQVRSQELST